MDEIKAISRILGDLMEIEDRLDKCSKKHKTAPRKKPENRFDRKPIFRPGEWAGRKIGLLLVILLSPCMLTRKTGMSMTF